MILWAIVIIGNIISITFTLIGLKWMYRHFLTRYALRDRYESNFPGIPAAKTIAILYLFLSLALSATSFFVLIYFN